MLTDLRHLISAMNRGLPEPEPKSPPPPGTTLADAQAFLNQRGLWRGRAKCRHVYTNSEGGTIRLENTNE